MKTTTRFRTPAALLAMFLPFVGGLKATEVAGVQFDLPSGVTAADATPEQLAAGVKVLGSLEEAQLSNLVEGLFSAIEPSDVKEAVALISGFCSKVPGQIEIVVTVASATQPALAPVIATTAAGALPNSAAKIAAAAKAGVASVFGAAEGDAAGKMPVGKASAGKEPAGKQSLGKESAKSEVQARLDDAIDLGIAAADRNGPVDGWFWSNSLGNLTSGYFTGSGFLNPANYVVRPTVRRPVRTVVSPE